MKRSQIKFKISFRIFLLLIIIGCTNNSQLNNEDELNLAITSEITTLDPANSYDGISAQIVYQVWETLFEYDHLKRPYSIKPLLAESLPELSKDLTEYTFKIKKGIIYHNDPCFYGKKRYLVAQDFVNQIKRLAFIPTKSSGYWLFEGKIKGIENFRQQAGSSLEKFNRLQIEGVKAIDERTFSIKLTRPFPQILNAFTMSFTAPVSMEAINFYKNDLSVNTVGTGPYLIQRLNLQGDSSLKVNPNYHGPTPDFKKVNFHLIKEDQSRWLNFLAKKIDIIQIPVDNFLSIYDKKENSLKAELREKGISLHKGQSFTYWWLSFNMKDPLLGRNKLLRQSIASAIDRTKLIALFTNDLGIIANSIIPIGIQGHSGNSHPFNYDPEKARSLLKAAGFPNGEGLPTIKLDTRSTDTKSRQKAEFIKKNLEEVGIRVAVQTNTFPAYLTKAREGNLQFFFDGWTMDYPDPENALSLLLKKNFPPGPNASFYHNDQFENLFESFLRSPWDNHLVQEMEKIINDELPWIMLYYDSKAILVHKKIKNLISSDFINNYIKYLKKN